MKKKYSYLWFVMKRMILQFIALLSLSMAASPYVQAQPIFKKRSAAVAKEPAAAFLKFNADDPIGNLQLSTAGTPWEESDIAPVKMPEGFDAELPEPLPDVSKITAEEYNAAVNMAFECLRILYGEMSEADAEKFSAMWAPLYGTPSQELIDYFNKLNPLLSQFLVARESYFRTASDVQLLYMDAAEAVEQDEREAFDAIIFESKILVGCMQSLEAAMVEIANRIRILGNPPNPFIAKAQARRRYNSAFTKKEKTVYLGECWMGTRPSYMSMKGVPPLTEVMFRYLFKAQVDGEDRFYVVELSENGSPTEEESDDENAVLQYLDVKQYDCPNSVERPDFTSDGKFQTYLPKPPVMAITSMTMTYLMQREASQGVDTDFFNAVCRYGNRVMGAGFFFKAAVEWSSMDKWNQYTYYKDGVIPQEALDDFAEAVREEIRREYANQNKSAKAPREAAAQPMSEEAAKQKYIEDSLKFENQSKQESIASRQELIQEVEGQISREYQYRERASERYNRAATDAERRSAQAEIEDIDRRIMYMRSNIQNERDNIMTLQTGEYVHTRTDFDEYSHSLLIKRMQEDAARRDATRRYANGIERQIKLLPTEEEREAARERAEKLFYEDGALVSGDLEKARKLAHAINNKILGHELMVQAEAEEAIAYADLKEASANAAIMACGAVTVGLAAEAFAATYGTGAAVVTYGPKVIGALYGGATGYIAGGTAKGVCSAAGYIHPVTQAMASFYEGYTDKANVGKSTSDKIWEGAKKAGFDYIVNKGLEFCANTFAKTCHAYFNKGTAKPSFKEKLDIMRTQRQRLDAQDALKTFSKASGEYKRLVESGTATAAQLSAAKANRDRLASVLNADYHAKWHMKYKASNELKASFNDGVQANYDKMIPKMKTELAAKGFKMDDIEFKPFRNASSAGTSSMDLDMGPVSKSTGAEPAFFRNGKEVSPAEFMKEAQSTMNTVYRQQTGMSAKASEMNFTTSAHPEAFNTTKLLEKNIDFSTLTRREVASVGKVIDVKMKGIEGNVNMTATTKVQAKAREASKEIENMLLPKLKQDLNHAVTTKQINKANEISKNLEYWQGMQNNLTEIGKQTNDPLKIMLLNNKIKDATGGKDVTQVVNDLAREFDVKW